MKSKIEQAQIAVGRLAQLFESNVQRRGKTSTMSCASYFKDACLACNEVHNTGPSDGDVLLRDNLDSFLGDQST